MNKVKVFSTKTCPYCYMLKDYLEAKNIKFDDVMVDEDRDAAMEMIRISGQRGVPVAQINNEVIVGFDQAKIDQALV
jgi:glutaredoxin 3